MAVTRTPNLLLGKHDKGDLDWDAEINSNFDIIDTEIAKKADSATGVGGTVTIIAAVQYDSVGQKYQAKTQQITVTDGVITTIGAESDWVDIATV